jgi:dCTP deaminase
MPIQRECGIRELAINCWRIAHFSEDQVPEGVISYGYDYRVSDEFKISSNVNSVLVDSKWFDERFFVSSQADLAIVSPNSFVLA